MPLLLSIDLSFLLPVLLGVGLMLLFQLYDYVSKKLPLFIIRPGNKVGQQTPEDFGLEYQHLGLRVSPTIELDAYFIPATVTARLNLIVLHGVGSCKEAYLPQAEQLCRMGYNLFLVDQRQHGKSGGRYLTYGHREKHDVSKMIDWLEKHAPGLKTGIYGNSMGAAVALQSMDHDHRLAFGLIESTFTDLPSVTRAYSRLMAGYDLPRWLTDFVLRRAGQIADFDPWAIRPIDAVTKINRPLQFIHGDADARINVANGMALYQTATTSDKALYLVPGGDHADLWEVNDDAYPKHWFGFLERMILEQEKF